MAVKVNINKNWQSNQLAALQKGLLEMTFEIDRRAKILAPHATGALVNSGRIKRLSQFAMQVMFGSSRVPYARKRHFENEKNPSTTLYLEKAGQSIARGDKAKYFRNKGL